MEQGGCADGAAGRGLLMNAAAGRGLLMDAAAGPNFASSYTVLAVLRQCVSIVVLCWYCFIDKYSYNVFLYEACVEFLFTL